MIGTINPKHKEVTIVGAGVSGMLAAHALDQAGFEVTLLEGAERSGGLIATASHELGLAESGAHSLLATAAVHSLAGDLGIELAEVRRDSRGRFILRDGRMRKFPLRPTEAMGAFFRAYFVLADKRLPPDQLSFEQWGERFLGKAALQYILTPFVRGVYGADPAKLMVQAAFPMLVVPHGHSLLSHALSRAFRKKDKTAASGASKQKTKHRMVSPIGGMGALTQALDRSLSSRLGSRFKKGSTVTALPDCANLLLAVPAFRAAPLLAQADSKLSAALGRITYTPMVSVTVFAENEAFPKPVKGVGVLIPEGEQRNCLGVLFNSSSFPGRVKDESRHSSFTVMLGGSARPELLRTSDEEMRRIVEAELRAVLGMTRPPVDMVIHRWEHAIPQYNTELLSAWSAAATGWCSSPGRILFGNYTNQVSLRGMIEQAAKLRDTLAAGLQS